MPFDAFKKVFRAYFTFNRHERQGFTLLAILLAISIFLNLLSKHLDIRPPDDFSAAIKIIEANRERKSSALTEREVRLFPFNPNTIPEDSLELLSLPSKIKSNLLRYREKGGRFKKADDFRKLYGITDSLFRELEPYISIRENAVPIVSRTGPASLEPAEPEYFSFDPNTMTREDMERLGFSRFMQNNIQSYRERGGRFGKKSDLARIYGMDSAFYLELEPWIVFSESMENKRERAIIQVLDINTADSAAFLTLPGIGPSFSGRIVRYRINLGGYHSLAQLRDLYGMTEERFTAILPYVTLSATPLRRIRINFTEAAELWSHPYISADAARKIIKVRSDKGPYQSLDALKSENIFDGDLFDKLQPYLDCN